jgi:hypothetical protein
MLASICSKVTRVVLVAIVHGLEFAAVNGDDVGEKVQTTAQCNKLAAHRPYRQTVITTKVGDGLEIRRQPPGQPHHLQIALRFAFQPQARLKLVQMAIDVNLQERRWVVRGVFGRRRAGQIALSRSRGKTRGG